MHISFTKLGSAGRVMVPFAIGYIVSYLFRTVNAVIGPDLARELGLSSGDLGLLTSVYFLTFAGAQLPLGLLLDRFGPSRVQIVLLSMAAAGAALFGAAGNLQLLLVGRALVGLGVSGALMAALKANTIWLPRERLTLANAAIVACGGLGAFAGAGPSEALLRAGLGWRDLFYLLAALTAGVALLIHVLVPKQAEVRVVGASGNILASLRSSLAGLRPVYTDPFFWRLAPACGSVIGTAWAVQGLWAARWLAEVDRLPRESVVAHLSTMALALAVGAVILGVVSDRMKRAGVSPLVTVAGAFLCFAAIEAAIIARLPIPAIALWSAFASFGGATVLGYAALAERFSKELAGRANTALNLIHVGTACALQSVMGLIVDLWPASADGSHPAAAYTAAFTLALVLQLAALLWLLVPLRRGAAAAAAMNPSLAEAAVAASGA
jgi:MFS family permease